MPPEEKDTRAQLVDRWKDVDLQFLRLDELDIRLLDKLIENSRRSNTVLARALGVAESTIRRRIGHMEEMGLIKGYSVLIDYNVVENPVKAYLTIRADGEHRLKIIRRMCQHPRTLAVYRLAGEDSILCVMLFMSTSEYQEFTDRQPMIEGARSASMQVIMAPYKGTVWSGA